MPLDMEQLRRIFYEECRENLEILERELLAIDPNADIDLEIINTIFRAAHSIKGGGATFNLNEISLFTHDMETLLDEAREGRRRLDLDTIDLLLKGGDCINNMLIAYETNSDFDHDFRDALSQQYIQLLEKNTGNGRTENVAATDQLKIEPLKIECDEIANQHDWIIVFTPHREMFFTGNDPLRILREMFELGGQCVVRCISDALPALNELEAEMCYLSWHIQLEGHVDRASIDDIFEWVEDECELEISRHSEPPIGKNTVNQQDTSVHSDNSIGATATSLSKPLPSTPSPSTPELAATLSSSKSVQSKPETLSSIRVEIEKVDNLINLVGELVITQSMLTELSQNFSESKLERLQVGLDLLLQNTKELQDSVLNIRMLPISFAFNRFPRLVRDLSAKLGKSVKLVMEGEQTELDKTVLERITDPLVHLVRNAVDHGIETSAVRLSKSKSEIGYVFLNAYHQGGSIIIEVRDDGVGLNKEKICKKAMEKGLLAPETSIDELSDKQIYSLLFSPGFSTAEEISDVSGRGVGMDVVKRNIEELGGHIDVDSEPDAGSVFRISLPLTLAILDGQLVKLADQVFVVPLISIIESIQIEHERVKIVTGGIELYRLRDVNIPIFRLKEEFGLGDSGELDKKLLCFVEAGGNRIGLLLDEMMGQQQVVIKSLESNYTRVNGISGATILGDGSVSLILDIQGLINGFLKRVSDKNNHIAA